MPRVEITDEAYKKVKQVVDRPVVTKQNINDEYFRHPPDNMERKLGSEHQAGNWDLKEGRAAKASPTQMEESVNEETGRIKKLDQLAEIVREDSIHR